MSNEQSYNPPYDPLLSDLTFNSELKNVALQAYKRLTTDKRMNEVILKFQRKGIEDRWIKWLLDMLPTIHGEWEAIKDESLKERRKRHSKLAEKMQALAEELNRNEDTRYFSICNASILWETYELFPETRDLMRKGLLNADGIVLSQTSLAPHPPVTPTISEYLSGFAILIERGGLIPNFDEGLFESLPYKRNIQSYAIKRISEMILDVMTWSEIKKVRQFPNKEVAILVNILLDLNDPKDAVTENDVTQARIKVRRHLNDGWMKHGL